MLSDVRGPADVLDHLPNLADEGARRVLMVAGIAFAAVAVFMAGLLVGTAMCVLA